MKVVTNTQMETIQETRLFDSPNSSIRSWRKMPKLLRVPQVKASTRKKATATTHPQPPSGTSEYTFGPKKRDHLHLRAIACRTKSQFKWMVHWSEMYFKSDVSVVFDNSEYLTKSKQHFCFTETTNLFFIHAQRFSQSFRGDIYFKFTPIITRFRQTLAVVKEAFRFLTEAKAQIPQCKNILLQILH